MLSCIKMYLKDERVEFMDATQQITTAKKFLEAQYYAKLLETLRKGDRHLVLDFQEFSKFDPVIAEELLEEPEEVLGAFEMALESFDFPPEQIKQFHFRVTNLPDSQRMLIRNVRSVHLGKFLQIDGVVRQKSDVRPQVTSARFECPSCGNIISVLQLDTKFKEPSRCGCGRKGKFKLIAKELVDAQGLVLEEAPEDLEGGEQPKRINVFLKNDLVSPLSEKKTNPGNKIRINGIIKEVPIELRSGAKSTRYEILLEGNYLQPIEEDFTDITISEQEEQEIKDLAQDQRLMQKLVSSIAPSIYGHEKIKEALLLQLAGGVRKVRDDGVVTRGDIHVLLIGDPGAGKCVSGDTRIMLLNGEIIPIKKFVEQQTNHAHDLSNDETSSDTKISSINLFGMLMSSQPLRFWRRKAPKEMLKIVTGTGNELVVTKEHPLFTTKNGVIFAKEAQDYQRGEYLALPNKIKVEGSLQKIPKDILYSPANNRVKHQIKDFCDSDVARFLGYLVGDGYVRIRKTTGFISFTNANQELLHDFEQLSQRVLGIIPKRRRKQGTSAYEYYLSSIEAVRILEKVDANITKKSADMQICRLITLSPNVVLKEFLRSLFECEACIYPQKREIEFSSKSKDLIFDLKYVLLRFGIISQVSSGLKSATNTIGKIKRRYYRLRISGENVLQFAKEIGFVSQTKRQRLQHLVEKDCPLNTNINVVPHMRELLTLLRRRYGLSQASFGIPRPTYQHYERGDRYPSLQRLQQISAVYEKLAMNDPFVKILATISHADLFWDKIKEITVIPSQESEVYDLEIEHVHNFVANGVMVHNSQLLKRITKVAPKSRYVSGRGATAAGLTASVVKDEFLRGWALEAGALVLANKGICMLDEMDKMTPEDRSAMHEALEQQSVSISKANIQATLRAETTVLAAANPKFGRFDPYETLSRQIDLPPTLINRFDLIFPIRDIPDTEKDSKMAKFILMLHQSPSAEIPDINTRLLRKYIAYARQRVKPVLTDSAVEAIEEYYLKMRGSGSKDGEVQAIPISARQLEALVRLTEASAKLRLSGKALKKDALKAIELLHFCLCQVGIDPETGKIDIDRISTGVPATERSKIVLVREIIHELENTLGKTIPIDDIIKEAVERGIEEEKVEEAIEQLKRKGDIFEPRKGFLSRI